MGGAARNKKIPAQLVEDEDYRLRHERVAGTGIAKAKGDVAVRLPPAEGRVRRQSRVWEVPATVPGIVALAARLLEDGVELVSMEPASDYWRVWYCTLEAAGLRVQLVSSSAARQLAGRPKTDRLDAQWIARLTEMGLLAPCFVPPPEIRELRDWTRARLHLVRDRTAEWQRLEKLLEGALVKVSSVVSALAGNKTARAIVEALIEGERDPQKLAGLALGSLRGRRRELAAALEGAVFGAHHARLARMHLDRIDALDRNVAALGDEIAACLEAIPAAWGVTADGVPSPDPGQGAAVLAAAARLAEIPGMSLATAMAVIAETGLDMSRFPTAGHLASWAGLAPSARQSGNRTGSRARGRATPTCAATAPRPPTARRTETFLGERLRRLSRRIGGARARSAVARSVLVIIWHLLKDPSARFTDLGADWHARKTDRNKKISGHLRQLRALGLEVTVTEAAA